MKITASAPGKLMLYGEHAVVYGSPCIVTAVDQRVRVSIEPNGEGEIHVCSPNVGLDEYHKKLKRLGKDDVPKSMQFVEHLIKRFYEKYQIKEGVRISTESDFSSQFGFGSSAAVVAALTKALSKYFDKEMDDKAIFEMAYQAVLDVQGVGSGFDVAASVYGGTIYYVTPGTIIETVYIEDLPMVVGYTGVKADTPTLIRQVAELKRNEKWVDSVFGDIADLVNRAKKYFVNQDFVQLGKLMNKNQKLLSTLNVSSVELDMLIKATKDAGAYGAKLSGAGGGDCMIALIDEKDRERIGKEIEQNGGVWMKVKTGAEGVRLE
jgi:mevalonate kinase